MSEPFVPGPFETDPGPMPRRAGLFLGIYLILLNVASLTILFLIWPGMQQTLPNWAISPHDEIRLLLISTVSGALGCGVVLLVSFVSYVGNRQLMSSWALWYVARPIVGTVVGLFVYIAIRGGILKTGSDVSVDVLNPYSVATIAGLRGAFSKQILDKLQHFADSQFRTPPPTERLDQLRHSE